MADRGVVPDVLHTSVLTRAIRTAELALAPLDRAWIPVRRHWRLNERHYGDLQGLNKKETAERFGTEQVKVWRRAYDVPPPAMAHDDPRNVRHDPRYADLPPEIVPDTECLADVVEQMLPYWYDAIVPDLQPGRTVLVAAHGNSLRALVKHLSDISDDDIVKLDVPTGEPLRVRPRRRLPAGRRPARDRALPALDRGDRRRGRGRGPPGHGLTPEPGLALRSPEGRAPADRVAVRSVGRGRAPRPRRVVPPRSGVERSSPDILGWVPRPRTPQPAPSTRDHPWWRDNVDAALRPIARAVARTGWSTDTAVSWRSPRSAVRSASHAARVPAPNATCR